MNGHAEKESSVDRNSTQNDTIDIAGASDIGKKRSENQDHFLIADMRRQLRVRSTDVPMENDELYGCPEGNLLVVADGMGGHAGGEQASRTAVQSAMNYVLNMMQWFLKLSPADEDDFLDELSNSLHSMQEQIWSKSGSLDRRMGTTVTMAYLLRTKVYVVHAGDSRCYLLRGGELRQLTTDHTLAQQLLDAGAISEADMNNSRWRHVLWNCVGGGDAGIQPEAMRCNLQSNDTILLCSDGLNGMLSDDEIGHVLRKHQSSSDSVSELLRLANQAGGKDNITAIVCQVGNVSDCEEISGSGTDTTIIEPEIQVGAD